jgi:hypothetical protein
MAGKRIEAARDGRKRLAEGEHETPQVPNLKRWSSRLEQSRRDSREDAALLRERLEAMSELTELFDAAPTVADSADQPDDDEDDDDEYLKAILARPLKLSAPRIHRARAEAARRRRLRERGREQA